MVNIEDQLTDLVREALKKEFEAKHDINAPFLDIEDYTAKTGKRFRITRSQKEKGLTREQAFQEFMEDLMRKS